MGDRTNPYVEQDPKVLSGHGKDIMIAASKASFYTAIMGKTNDDIIKTQVENHSGKNTVTMSMRALVRGSGVKGNTDLDSNRDQLNFLHQNISGDIIANSIASQHTKINSKTVAQNFRRDANEGLGDWLQDKMDRIRTARLSENCSNVVSFNAAGALVANTALVAGDVFTTKNIDEMLKRAENGWIDGNGIYHPRIRPYKTLKRNIKGQETEVGFYLIRIGAGAKESLQDDPLWIAYQETLAKSTQAAGEFVTSGQLGEYKNAIVASSGNWDSNYEGIITSDLIEYEDYASGFDSYAGAGGVTTEVNLLLGATAGMQPFAAIPEYIEDSLDSGRKMLAAIDEWFGFEKTRYVGKTAEEKKLVWHDKDYGVIASVQTLV